MLKMGAVDDKTCLIRIYQQAGNPVTWLSSFLSTCFVGSCQYKPLVGTDYIYWDDLHLNNDNGYAFYMVWDDIYWLTWKQEKNPLSIEPLSTEYLLIGDYGVSSNIHSYGTLLDFGGLGRSTDSGVLLDGRSDFGSWFSVGVTESIELTQTPNTKIPGWRNRAQQIYWANTVILYLWNTTCGTWRISSLSPTNPPTTPPTKPPSPIPTSQPSRSPTPVPTTFPTKYPTSSPTDNPSPAPTVQPTPTSQPTDKPTQWPTYEPSPGPIFNVVDIEVKSSNEDHFLYMITGFSVGGFLVICFFLIICWKRFDGNQSEDMTKTMVEIERIRNSRIRTLDDKTILQHLDLSPTLGQLDSNLSLSRISRSRPCPSIASSNSRLSHMQIEGAHNTLRNSGNHKPVEIMRRSSMSRSRSHIRNSRKTSRNIGTPQRTPTGHDELNRMEFSYGSIPQTPMELSSRTNTINEPSVIRKRVHLSRRSSLSSRVIKQAKKKLDDAVRETKRTLDSSESETDSSESSDVKLKSSTAPRNPQGILENIWVKGKTEASLQDIWSDDDVAETSLLSMSGVGKQGRDDSIVIRGSE